ncbi:MAG: Trk system potassium transporter TrkA [Clostridia bacterium]|nr:Trk system potassium transporter TrkA [Clostridia bacterium]
MKIIVVGCGKIGKTIIESLVKERHEVFAVDSNPDVVEEIRNLYDVICLCGNGTEYENLKSLGVDKAELFIAVTPSDELNMLACFAAKRMGAHYTVARIRNLENNDASLDFFKEQLELSMAINPERLAAEAIYQILKLPSATKVETFAGKEIAIIEVLLSESSALDGISLMELKKRHHKENFLIATVQRGEEVFIPKGNFQLKTGDKIGIVISKREAQRLLNAFGEAQKSVKDVIIVGAGTTSTYLAKMLTSSRQAVRLIECDQKRCEEVCELLPDNITVIHGDGMSQELLMEEGILNTDAFVALTDREEDNILISFYAMSQEVPKVICRAERDEISSIAEKLGLACMISPRKIAADVIVKYARALENSLGSQIETLYSLMNGMAEALEFKVLSDFEYTNIPLKQMKLHENVLVAGITRGRKAIIPTGDDVILPGDDVVIVAEGKRILSLSDIIAR